MTDIPKNKSVREGRMREKKRAKILSFEQKGDFYFKRGLDRLDENKLPDALYNYRLALEREPESEEILLAIAEVLTEMERYEESNAILFRLMSREEHDAECYYGMGCNFVALYDYEHAKDCLEQYVDVEPEGEFVYDAFDMLDAIDDAEYYERERLGEEGLIELDSKEDALYAADEGRRLLEQSDYEAAEAELERALKLDPSLDVARNNMTLLYYCRKEYKRAIKEAERVLERDGENAQAMCNLAMLKHAFHDDKGSNAAADKLVAADVEEPDDLNRLTLILIDLARYEDAYRFSTKLLKCYPYNANTVHRLAFCCYHTARYQEAAGLYDMLLKIDSSDTIARYYRGVCRKAQLSPQNTLPKGKYMVNYQVPYDEMISRISKLSEVAALSRDELLAKWRENDELSDIIRWSFTLPAKSTKKAVLHLAASIGDEKAEGLLREFLVQADQEDEYKQEVFALLIKMGAKEPYVAYIGGKLVESRMSAGMNASKPYRDALELCVNSMHAYRTSNALSAAVVLWEKYMRFYRSDPPRLTKPQTTAFAAALEFQACKEAGEKAARADICARYGITALRLKNALNRLEKTMPEKWE